MTHESIAAKLGVHRTTVSRTLTKYNRRAIAKLESTRLAETTKQLRRLEWIAEQAAHGWKRSLEDAETIKETEGGQDGGKTERTTKGQSGNPAMLAQMREALAEIRGILKLDEIGNREDEHRDPIQPDTRHMGKR